MIRGLYSASTGMNAQQYNLDVISNNISNVNTAGYKKLQCKISKETFDSQMIEHKQKKTSHYCDIFKRLLECNPDQEERFEIG